MVIWTVSSLYHASSPYKGCNSIYNISNLCIKIICIWKCLHNKIWPYVQFYSILFIFICLCWWWWSNGWPGQDINKEGPFYLHKIFVYFYDKYINFLRIIIKVTIIFLRNIHTFTPEWLGKKFRWQFFILDELLLSIYTFNRDQYTGFVSYVFYDAQFELFISLNDVNTEIYDFFVIIFLFLIAYWMRLLSQNSNK